MGEPKLEEVMIRWLALAVVAASTLGGCRSPTMAPKGQGIARPDAPADVAAPGIARRDAQADPAAIIEYRGEEVRLTKRYDDFDKYKNDPNNIAPEEHDRVRKLVEAAPVPEHCANRAEVFRVLSDLEFPGYGSNGVGERGATDPLRVIGGAVEIPQTDTSRVVVYVRDDSGYRLADDTVLPEPPIVTEAIVRDGKVTYRTFEGKVIAERPIRSRSHP
jgi:hypothetical protein